MNCPRAPPHIPRESGRSTFTQKQEKSGSSSLATHAPIEKIEPQHSNNYSSGSNNRQGLLQASCHPFPPRPSDCKVLLHTMKRSRTCQCLVELDSPKRTRSTPDLAALRRKHHIFERERTLDDSMMTASVGLDGPLHILWRASSPVGTCNSSGCQCTLSILPGSAGAGAAGECARVVNE